MLPAAPRRGGRGRLERGADGVSDELRGFRVDGDAAAQQHAADDVPGVPGHVLGGSGHSSGPSRDSHRLHESFQAGGR